MDVPVMSPETLALVVAGVAGASAASLADTWKQLTGAKPSTAFLRVLVLGLVAVTVVGLAYLQRTPTSPIDWGTVVAQLMMGWSAALATHDLFSPRRKRRDLPPPS